MLLALAAMIVAAGSAHAALDLNVADAAQLRTIRGIGPARADAIVEERARNGPYASLDDVAARVKGIGERALAGWKKDGSLVAAPSPVAASKASSTGAGVRNGADPGRVSAGSAAGGSGR